MKKQVILSLLFATLFTTKVFSVLPQPVSSHTCFINPSSVETTDLTKLIPQTFYYNPEQSPQMSSWPNLICHDVNLYGKQDSIFYPRINFNQFDFFLFNKADPVFDEGIEALNTKLGWEAFGAVGKLGYALKPFSYRGRVICPDFSFINNDEDPRARQLEEILGYYYSQTEALYEAKPVDPSQNQLTVYIPASELKYIGFHITNGNIQPGYYWETKRVYVFWPANKDHPYEKQPGQVLYSIEREDKTISDGRKFCVIAR